MKSAKSARERLSEKERCRCLDAPTGAMIVGMCDCYRRAWCREYGESLIVAFDAIARALASPLAATKGNK